VSHLGYDRAEAAMSKPLLETGEKRLLITRLDMDQPIRGKPCLCQRWRKQVRSRDTPEDFASRPCRYPGSEKPSRGAIDSTIPATGNFMQTSDR
jgi:hypothetical protein